MLVRKDSNGVQPPQHTNLACEVWCIIPLRQKDKKKSEPFPIWKIWFGLYWSGAADETKSEQEVLASVTCPSMDFMRWSSEE